MDPDLAMNKRIFQKVISSVPVPFGSVVADPSSSKNGSGSGSERLSSYSELKFLFFNWFYQHFSLSELYYYMKKRCRISVPIFFELQFIDVLS